jgi:hypothetical protein
MKTFLDHRDYATTLRQVVGRIKQPNETMAQYYFGKMNLLQACNIGGKEVRSSSPEQLYAEYLSLLTTDTRCPQDIKRKSQWESKGSARRYEDKPPAGRLHKPMTKPVPRCFNCNKLGHQFRQCRQPKLECNRCNKIGHDENQCPSYKKAKPVVDPVHSTGTQECYFIDSTVNGTTVRAYIDTGCSITTICS